MSAGDERRTQGTRRLHEGIQRLLLISLLAGCGGRRENPSTVVMAIENSPTNLDRRIGTDAMSERIGNLIFDPLVRMDEHYEMQPWLATSWEQPDRLTWVFHLRDGVRFHDGRPLAAEDVAWTIDSMLDGSLLTSKSGAFAKVAGAEARGPLTVVVRMKEADASLLFNLSDSLFGVVPRGSGKDFGRRPVGSGPFRFVSQEQDKDVVIERNPDYWGTKAKLDRVRFAVIPDAVTVALELEKGSADIASNQLTLDMVHALEGRPGLKTETGPGSAVMYLNFNVSRGPLADVRVRQAIACAMNKPAMVHAVWRDQARLASTLLPEGHWARAAGLPVCGYDPARARALLAQARFANGLKLEMKTSQGRYDPAGGADSAGGVARRGGGAYPARKRVRHVLLGRDRGPVRDVCAALDRKQRRSGHLPLCVCERPHTAEGCESRALQRCAGGCPPGGRGAQGGRGFACRGLYRGAEDFGGRAAGDSAVVSE